MAEVILDIKTQIADLRKDLDKVQKGMKQMGDEGKKANQKIQQEVQKTSRLTEDLRGTITSVFAVGTVISLGKAIINVRMEFEKFEAMLKVALGSAEEANKEFKKIQDFASNTPFSVRELTDSFVRLVNYGFKPTTKQMKAMGDLSAALGKDFIQLTEAIVDAQRGEFERLKEFGIKASKQGDEVALTFKGITKEVEFTEDAIADAIIGFGEMEGVAGTMEEVSKTLGGQLSNLQDSLTMLANSLGEMGSSEVGSGILVLKSLVDIVNNLIELEFDLGADKGVLGFLSKVNERLRDYIGLAYGPLTGAGRQAFAENLGALSEKLDEVTSSTEEVTEVTEDNIEANKEATKSVKELAKARKEYLRALSETQKLEEEETEYFDEMIDIIMNLGEEQINVIDSIQEELKQSTTDRVDHEIAEYERGVQAAEAAEMQKKLILQGTAEAAISALDLIGAANKDNAKLQQIVSISQAIINGALGITKTAAQLGYPAAIPFQVALGLQTLAQIATIRQQKFARGHFEVLGGDRHAQGGVHIGVGEAEQGEGLAVFSRAATQKYGKFLPAFVKAINENDGEFGYSDGAYMINFDDSKSVKELKSINKALNKPEIRYEKGYRIETRKGQVTRVKI